MNNLQTLCLSCHGKKDQKRTDYSKRNHASGDRHGMAKLSTFIVKNIRIKSNNGLSKNVLAVEYGVSLSTIKRIINNKSWKVKS